MRPGRFGPSRGQQRLKRLKAAIRLWRNQPPRGHYAAAKAPDFFAVQVAM